MSVDETTAKNIRLKMNHLSAVEERHLNVLEHQRL